MATSTSFLQSAAWERFQKAAGKETVRIDGMLAVKQHTPVGSYWYVPRPVLTVAACEALLAHDPQAMFVRVDPESVAGALPAAAKPVAATQPQDSLVLSLQSDELLLQGFHEKTRYNIRLAERKGVTVTSSAAVDSKELAAFLALSAGTGERQAFHYHPNEYYQAMLASLGAVGDEGISVSVVAAWQGETPLAALIALFAPGIAYYLHGASSYEHRSLMAPHLLQFRTMQLARDEHGATRYDFWGIAPEGAPDSHPWAGVTRFKLGFGGERVHYPDSVDLVIQLFRYTLYRAARQLKRSV